MSFFFDSEIFADKHCPLVMPLADMYRYGIGFEKTVNNAKIGQGVSHISNLDIGDHKPNLKN